MMKTATAILSIIVALSFALAACSSSDEMTQQTAAADSLALRARGTNFTTNQDTVVASVSTQLTSPARASSLRGANADVAFTVQIGAFAQPQHALKAQQTAKARFNTYPVFNQYEPSLKLYRISIGKFENREEATRIMQHIMFSYPKEYVECWLNTIAK
jgi:cell division septation protein DedD